MTFTEHLGELRVRLIRVSFCLVAMFFVGWFISVQLLQIIQWPLNEGTRRYNDWAIERAEKDAHGQPVDPKAILPPVQWITLTPQEALVCQLKISFFFALLIGFPFIIFQFCAFIFPGLRQEERNVILVAILGGTVLAVGGTFVAYFGVLPFVMPYLLQYNPPGVEIQLQLAPTISFILVLIAGFAIAFQFPMGVLMGVVMGLVSVDVLTNNRRLAVVVLAVVAAVFTPPDPYSMLIMMLPLYGLYEASILLAKAVAWWRGNKPAIEGGTDIVPKQD